MVLVDASIWVRFLANRLSTAATLEALLDADDVAGHELVYGELLVGDRAGRASFLAAYAHITHANTVPHAEVVAFVRHRGLSGRGAGWIDAHLLASALVGKLQLWTADVRLLVLARELGVAFEHT